MNSVFRRGQKLHDTPNEWARNESCKAKEQKWRLKHYHYRSNNCIRNRKRLISVVGNVIIEIQEKLAIISINLNDLERD